MTTSCELRPTGLERGETTSYELIAITFLGVITGLLAVVEMVVLVKVERAFREISRIQRAVAALVVQESDKLQGFLRA